jgi:ferrous iron transport protein A
MRRGLKKRPSRTPARTLADLRSGEEGILESLDLPQGDARRLMELGFLPGTVVGAGRAAPGGDPRVFRVDGSEIALRRATARQIHLKPPQGGTP